MTAPITGPYSTAETTYQPPYWFSSDKPKELSMTRQWYRQAKPYDQPLPFDFRRVKLRSLYTSNGPYGNFLGSDNWQDVGGFPYIGALPYVDARAYAKLKEELAAAVEGGVATAEGREATRMIVKRVTQMRSFTRNIFRGRFGDAAADIGVKWTEGTRRKLPSLPKRYDKPNQYGRESLRTASQLYLEYHFGWSPLCKDIYDAMEVIQHPIKPHRIRGRATGYASDPAHSVNTSSTDGIWNYKETREGTFRQVYKLQADVVITNPNLAMMQQWGILNPLSVAWELVPFSFVLDWFVTVGDALDSLTDFAGVQLVNAQRTRFTTMKGSGRRTSTPISPGTQNTVLREYWVEGAWHFRALGIGGGPTIALRAPKPWGFRRGLAAVSLLMQAFPRHVVDESALHLARKRTAFRQNLFPQFNGKYY